MNTIQAMTLPLEESEEKAEATPVLENLVDHRSATLVQTTASPDSFDDQQQLRLLSVGSLILTSQDLRKQLYEMTMKKIGQPLLSKVTWKALDKAISQSKHVKLLADRKARKNPPVLDFLVRNIMLDEMETRAVVEIFVGMPLMGEERLLFQFTSLFSRRFKVELEDGVPSGRGWRMMLILEGDDVPVNVPFEGKNLLPNIACLPKYVTRNEVREFAIRFL